MKSFIKSFSNSWPRCFNLDKCIKVLYWSANLLSACLRCVVRRLSEADDRSFNQPPLHTRPHTHTSHLTASCCSHKQPSAKLLQWKMGHFQIFKTLCLKAFAGGCVCIRGGRGGFGEQPSMMAAQTSPHGHDYCVKGNCEAGFYLIRSLYISAGFGDVCEGSVGGCAWGFDGKEGAEWAGGVHLLPPSSKYHH